MRSKTKCDKCMKQVHMFHIFKNMILCWSCYKKASSMTHFKCLKCKKEPIQDFNLSGLCPKCWQTEYLYKTKARAVTREIYLGQL